MKLLDGKRSLVTGGSAGIGKAIAASMCMAGAQTVIAARREGPLHDAAEEMGATPIVADISGDSGAEALAAAALDHLGGLDMLVLSAGVFMAGRLDERPIDEFVAMLGANVVGPLALARRCLPALIESRGDLVVINSTVTRAANISGRAFFAAGCHALKALTDGLRDEFSGQGVRVTSIYPGTSATPRTEWLRQSAGHVYSPDRLLQPADVANAVMSVVLLGPTAEVTDLYVRPRYKTD
jgi:NADP-dependent 3-hydroxy acid dehydrogenase YdfG